jgi:hypothetical protein
MLPALLSSVFLVLALWHFYMASRPATGASGAVPSVDGKPLFVPTARATVAVGLVLVLFAVLVAGAGGIVALGLPAVMLRWLCIALALGLLARAVGDFRYVGFFKRVRGSKFAKLDSLLYSPLCLALASGVFVVGLQSGR